MYLKAVLRSIFIYILLVSQASTAELSPKKEHLKAALTFNFINFTHWPEVAFSDQNMTYNICFAGDNAYSEKFNIISKQSIRGRKLHLIQLDVKSENISLELCQVLFVQFVNLDKSFSVLEQAKSQPILTISETENIRDTDKINAMITFINNNDRVGFTINRAIANQAGIKFSSKMLRLAVKVVEG